MLPKTIGRGPVLRIFACCLLPAKAKAFARACYLLLFPTLDSNPGLLDSSQARYRCTIEPAGVMQQQCPWTYMNYRTVIFFLAPAADQSPLFGILTPNCDQLDCPHLTGHMYCLYCSAATGLPTQQRPFNSLCNRRCAPGITPCVAASCASDSCTCCLAVLPMQQQQPF